MTKANIQRKFLTNQTIGSESEAACDLRIVCRDGVVRTHQAILAWSSGFLRRLCTSHFILEDGGKRKEDLMIYLHDYTVEVITAFINFMYDGEISRFASQILLKISSNCGRTLELTKYRIPRLLRTEEPTF